MPLTDTENRILAILGAALFGGEAPEETADWSAVCTEAANQAVPSFIMLNKYAGVSPEQLSYWRGVLTQSEMNNFRVWQAHGDIHKLLTEAGIEYVILKGCASAYYYADPSKRTMGDVDFLVHPEDAERTTVLLLENGFMQTGNNEDYHTGFCKGRTTFEMHTEPAGIPEGETGAVIRSYFSDIFSSKELVRAEGIEFYKPSDFHHEMVLLLHSSHHILSGGMGLRQLCDLAAFLGKAGDSNLSENLVSKLDAVGLWKFTRIMAVTCCRYLGLPFMEKYGDIPETITGGIITDILSAGNFGNKDASRFRESFAISGAAGNVSSKGKLKNLFQNLDKVACNRFPVIKKHPVLRPFVWLFYAVRYCIRVLLGKRKPVGKTLRAADKRIDIYKELKLFE